MRVALRWIANIRTASTPCHAFAFVAGLAAASLLAVTTLPAQAKTLRYASQDDPQTVDPHSANLLVTSRVVSQIYEPLVWRDDKWKPIPWLATSWQMVNDKTWRFKLREGVKFHDGATLSADDVVFSTERALSPTSQMRTAIQGIVAAKKIDALTVEFTLAEPNPALLSHLTNFRIMNKAWAEKHGATQPQDFKAKEDTFASRNANGTGAFRLKERQPDVRTILVRHEGWWGKAAGVENGNVTAVVMLLASFWSLVPGATSFISVSQAATGGNADVASMSQAGAAVVSIALGTLVGWSLFSAIDNHLPWSKLAAAAQ